MIGELKSGMTNAGQVRTLFLTDANKEIQTIIADIEIIKGQMAGVENIVAKKGQTVSEAILVALEGK